LCETGNSALIHEALTAESFELDRSESSFLKYRGVIRINGTDAICEIHIFDENFLSFPKLKILDSRFREHSVAHFESSGYYCYADSGENIINKYDPKGAVRSFLDMIKAALEHHQANDLADEIEREFPQHWFADSSCYAELCEGGDRTIKLVQVENDGGRYLLAAEESANQSLIGKVSKAHKKTPKALATLIEYNGPLTFRSGQSQPETLSQLVTWANSLEEGLGTRILSSFGFRGEDIISTAFIRATNGTVGVELNTSGVPPNLLKRKAGFGRMLAAVQNKVKIKRILCQSISQELIFQRNLPEGKINLGGKKIALVGCGTIGSHLAKMLAQSGAGYSEGHLILIDNQTLEIENIGRHFLGTNRIGQNKAKGCEQELTRLFPESHIKGVPVNLYDMLAQLEEYDLIIDATGEEASSVLLNEWLKNQQSSSREISGLFVRLFGNADAGQGLLVDGSENACFRCLKPRHGEDWRYEPRRNPNSIEITPTNCGEAPYLPYGIGGSVMVAGLAANMALDWASGKPSPRLRTVRINFGTTHNLKDVNPKISTACPLCGSNTQ